MKTVSLMRSGRIEMILRLVLAIMMLISIFTFVYSVDAAGAAQIAGTGTFDDLVECDEAITNDQGVGPDFALLLTGDLEGCLYTFVQTWQCTPGGMYIETGEEIFVADDGEGTFSTTYRFEAKYENCEALSGQVNGRCQHPIVAGSGTGKFYGVKGRLDFKDDVVNGIVEYRGHLEY